MSRVLRKPKTMTFERAYPVPVQTVWQAWTQPAMLVEWWGPEKTRIRECEVDLRVGGRLRIVMEATEEMGKYQGTLWPMEGVFTHVEDHVHLAYEARSWTEGEESTTTIHHVNDLTLAEADGVTTIRLTVSITEIGSKSKWAAFGMKWGYKQQLAKLERCLADVTRQEAG